MRASLVFFSFVNPCELSERNFLSSMPWDSELIVLQLSLFRELSTVKGISELGLSSMNLSRLRKHSLFIAGSATGESLLRNVFLVSMAILKKLDWILLHLKAC